jgi:preprotein translocase SecE subunit
VARDRQEAKRRQAERRAARLRDRSRAAGQAGDGAPDDGTARGRPPEDPAPGDGAGARDDPITDPAAAARLATAAPPEDTGRSDTVVESPPPAPHLEEDEGEQGTIAEPARRGRADERERGRVAAFLVAVWAELQRVQWPDRKTLITLTGVVLGFVLIAGGYLGALDAIVSRLIQAIL